MIGIMRQRIVLFHQENRGNAVVGLFGALEFHYLKGPVFCDHDYNLSTTILAVGDTPQTEYFWYESALYEPKNGEKVAETLNMTRIMKASSILYPELRKGS